MWQQLSDAPVDRSFHVSVGPQKIVFTGGMQPTFYRSDKGTLLIGSGVPLSPGTPIPDRNRGGVPINLISRTNGKTWERWIPPQPPEGAFGHAANPFNPNIQEVPGIPAGGLTSRRDGSVIAIETWGDGPDARGLFHTRIWTSMDDMASFSPQPATLYCPQGRSAFDDGGHPCSGLCFCRTMLELPSGDLLVTAYGWFEGDTTPCAYLPAAFRSRVVLFRSRNGGTHWDLVATLAVDPSCGEEGFNETALVRLSKGPHAGRLVALMRTGSNNCAIHKVVSDDEGGIWSKPQALPFGGVYPDLVEMTDGTLAASFGWRIWGGGVMQNYYTVFSRDGGETWVNLTRLPLEDHAATPYPCGTWYTGLREIEPGRLLVAYDFGAFKPTWPVKYIATREVIVQA